MSMNLGNNLSDEWDKKHDEQSNPFSVPQIGTEDSYKIYGDGIHENICKRLREWYIKLTKECIEDEASSKGIKNPFSGKDKKYYRELFEEELKNAWYMHNLEILEKISPSNIQWYVE